MYKVTTIDFDHRCKITFCDKKGKEFEIQCSSDFGEKFESKYMLFPNGKRPYYPKKSYVVRTYFINGYNIIFFKKKFSLLSLCWLKFRGFLSLLTEELFN